MRACICMWIQNWLYYYNGLMNSVTFLLCAIFTMMVGGATSVLAKFNFLSKVLPWNFAPAKVSHSTVNYKVGILYTYNVVYYTTGHIFTNHTNIILLMMSCEWRHKGSCCINSLYKINAFFWKTIECQSVHEKDTAG